MLICYPTKLRFTNGLGWCRCNIYTNDLQCYFICLYFRQFRALMLMKTLNSTLSFVMGGLNATSSTWPAADGLLTTADSLLPTHCCHIFVGHLNTINLFGGQLAVCAGWRASQAGKWAVRGWQRWVGLHQMRSEWGGVLKWEAPGGSELASRSWQWREGHPLLATLNWQHQVIIDPTECSKTPFLSIQSSECNLE